MKTRSQHKSDKHSHMKIRSQYIRALATISRVFLVTEETKPSNGWVVHASRSDEAIEFFQREVLKKKVVVVKPLDQVTAWDDYVKVEGLSESKRPFYMQKYRIGNMAYYVEALTMPGRNVAWVPATFD